MKQKVGQVAWIAGILLVCLPVGMIVTLMLIPLWRWIEANWGIESIGHSGPADWCFETIYGLCALTGLLVLWRQSRPR